jgi:hypothetical protein
MYASGPAQFENGRGNYVNNTDAMCPAYFAQCADLRVSFCNFIHCVLTDIVCNSHCSNGYNCNRGRLLFCQ